MSESVDLSQANAFIAAIADRALRDSPPDLDQSALKAWMLTFAEVKLKVLLDEHPQMPEDLLAAMRAKLPAAIQAAADLIAVRRATRILVCGGRAFADRTLLDRTLSPLARPAAIIIHGAAPGADALADAWAREHGMSVQAFPADWSKHGRGAGPKRNQNMLEEGKPDLVVAFPGGRGTADMVRRAKAASVTVVEVADA